MDYFNRLSLIVLMLFLLAVAIGEAGRRSRHKNRRRQGAMPGDRVGNDKIITVEGIPEKEMKQVLRFYSNIHNCDGYTAVPRLYVLAQARYLITFPYDVDFESFCRLLHYIHYPDDMGYYRRPSVTGWATASGVGGRELSALAAKRAMVYVPFNDNESGCVFITAEDNKAFCYNVKRGVFEQLKYAPYTYAPPKLKKNAIAGSEIFY